MNRLAERVCLVTGSTGMAAAAARRIAAEGGRVFVVSRTADHARALVDAINGSGGEADLGRQVQLHGPIPGLASDRVDRAVPEAPAASTGDREQAIDPAEPGDAGGDGGVGRCRPRR